MKQTLQVGLGQTLTMTPALQQAIRMLALSSLDLRTEIQNALESNVMLEAVDEAGDSAPADERASAREDSEQAAGTEAIPENLPVDVDWDQIYNHGTGSAAGGEGEPVGDWQANLSQAPDLYAYLGWQAEMADLDDTDRALAALIIDAIDADGRLRDWAELQAHLQAEFGVGAARAESVLARVQTFDPPGVAARSLSECLGLQLAQIEPDTPARALALRLAARCSPEMLAEADSGALAQTLDAAPEDVADALRLVRGCQPFPGDAFGAAENDYIVPEVSVTRGPNGWQVTLNGDIAPRVQINEQYLDLIKRGDQSAEQTTLKTHLEEARFFLNSLKSRNQTLLEVSQCIVTAQRAFLEYGEKALKPMVLRDVASTLGVHESTVSRATANKYMQTPRGTIELKYFFSSRVATSDGGSVSATAVQATIKAMINDETAGQPLSDGALADALAADGFRVARRTVAKYREGLGIAPSRQRRARRR